MPESTESTREHESETLVRRNSEGATLREGTGSDLGIRDDAPVVAVPDHELLCCVGRGSYGQVWLARNVMGTYRAVKIVERASFQNARPFDREFNGILKFEPLSRAHPGMVDILQVGRTPNCFYYVMELADDVATGQQIDPLHYTPKTLRTELDAHGRLPFERCLQLALALTDALGHLHAHGLIHRDIKPSNIIFVHDLPKLADIGLVADQADAKSFVGTEGFIPPEGPGTAQADLYSLGKVLYELATGKDRHDFPELPTFSDDGSTSDAGLIELNAVILKACQPDPKQRYASAAAMRDDLLLLQGGKSVKRSQALERRLARARKVTALAVLLVLLTTLAVLFFQKQARTEAALRFSAQASASEARRNLYAADMLLASRALDENNRGRAVKLLTKHLPENSGTTTDLRGWEWRMLWQRARSDELFTLGRHSNGVTALALAPDGHTLYSASNDHTVGIWDLAARRQIGALSVAGNVIALSPDGHSLANSGIDGSLRIWDLNSRTIRQVWTNTMVLSFIRFSPDGKRLVYLDASGVLRLDLASGATTRIFGPVEEKDAHFLPAAAFSRDGHQLACALPDDSIRLLDVENGGELSGSPLATNNYIGLGMAFSPDDQVLVSTGTRGTDVWDAASGRLMRHVPTTASWIGSPVFSTDGRLLATVSADQRIEIWDAHSWEPVATMRGHDFEVWAVLFTPEGSQLVTGSKDNSIRVWEVPTKQRSNVLARPEDVVADTLSSEGDQWLMLRNDGRWKVVTTATGEELSSGRLPLLGQTPRIAVAAGGNVIAWGTPTGLSVLTGRGTNLHQIRLPEGPFNARGGFWTDTAHFSPEGRRVLFENVQHAVRLLDLDTGAVETLFEPNGCWVNSVSFSPDGRWVAAGYSGGLVRWMDLRRRERHTFETGHDEVMIMEFSPDGKMLATAGIDARIRLWDLPAGAQRAELTGPLTAFLCLDFSADGRRLAGGSAEGQFIVWNVETSPPLEVLNSPLDPEHLYGVMSLAFRSDDTLVSLGWDGLRQWAAPSLDEIDRVRRAK